MDLVATPQADIIHKINTKILELKKGGLSREDQKVPKSGRLRFVWEDHRECSKTSVTVWRKTRACGAYKELQDVSDHLFFATVLVVTLTECGKTSFQAVLNSLVCLENYEEYQFRLESKAQKFLESTAAE
ncbi:uncharacterized protein BO87DRAFT_440624 [Aspergillus neoniger CBS 115656]|uniref:Uncharacterized protein n=1 Tax=Aspergillus neoniger (strain CBS 115656) TaxID=1448310 RepID=A0A318YDH3_ASPNB|nr:hypothetical protein BO87DRAFT_440624 [Aspergillus neoniger CBS 115656]PYH32074.1 hypothetical protein BO87DRAFT_440624 [Aspergillus neoniger CBS 115656]